MSENPKGLVVVPARGKALAFRLLPVAEHYAREMVKAGRGPVEIRSRYTGDVLAVYGEEEG
jgi:hypothetical protein